jgi:hypothetical protein
MILTDASRRDEELARDLRSACTRLRVTPMPLAELIPLLQRAADALDRKRENG